MDGTEIPQLNEEKDFRVTINCDFKPGKHCSKVVKTAKKLISFTGRIFDNKPKKVVLTLFSALVRPHLEHGVQF